MPSLARFGILAAFAAGTAIGGYMPAPVHAQQDAPAAAASSSAGNRSNTSNSLFTGKRTARQLAVQVLLDRAGFSPGVIDGLGGGNTESAIRAYQRANDMPVDGRVSEGLLQSLRGADDAKFIKVVRLRDADLRQPFQKIPESMAEQAKMKTLGYETPQELLGERYHMDVDLLKAMNAGTDFRRPGASIVVVASGPAKLDKPVDRIVVSGADNVVSAYSGDELIASYPATVGSRDMPSPSGSMTVRTVAPEATYTFDPATNDWGGSEVLKLVAGPNNPVGGVWIDLSKDTYGIHGSPDPALIGKTASHGCVRLTNWDARELADAVEAGASVEFVS
jgi:lipoprotein-anchoring transpeptidase ErfK/SrfK